MENHFVKYSLLKKRMTVKIKDPKKRTMHRIYIHINRIINDVNKIFPLSLTALISKCAIYIHMVLNVFYDL